MKIITINTKYFLIAGMITLLSAPVIAANALHTFASGDTIKASEMNDNFTTLNTAISNISVGFTIKDAGTYVGQVGLGELGNFSLLTGSGGATGVDAADAACAAAYPGSHAELDILALWKSAVNSELPAPAPAYGYWASTVTDFPVSGGAGLLRRTTDCDNWTNNASGKGGFVKPAVSVDFIDVQLDVQGCTASNMAVACFTTP